MNSEQMNSWIQTFTRGQKRNIVLPTRKPKSQQRVFFKEHFEVLCEAFISSESELFCAFVVPFNLHRYQLPLTAIKASSVLR